MAAGVVFGGIYFVMNLPAIKIAAASWMNDSRENYIDCEHLAFYPLVEKTFAQHQDLADKVKAIPGVTNFLPEQIKCKLYEGGMEFVKGQTVLEYKNRAARTQAEKLIGKDFFGIPYRGYEN